MARFLVFTLESQIASFGDLAGYERRKTGTWPAKSALIGLIGGALGVRREDKKGQSELSKISFTVAVFDSGTAMRDFHTAQAVHQKVKRPATRAIALVKGKQKNGLNTVLSKRDYRVGACFGVALWGGEKCLESIASALKQPVFAPYLGRKSCPLAAPLRAKVVEEENPISALDHVVLPPWRLSNDGGQDYKIKMYISDSFPGLQADYVESRYDVPVSRTQWHFQSRDVLFIRGSQ